MQLQQQQQQRKRKMKEVDEEDEEVLIKEATEENGQHLPYNSRIESQQASLLSPPSVNYQRASSSSAAAPTSNSNISPETSSSSSTSVLLSMMHSMPFLVFGPQLAAAAAAAAAALATTNHHQMTRSRAPESTSPVSNSSSSTDFSIDSILNDRCIRTSKVQRTSSQLSAWSNSPGNFNYDAPSAQPHSSHHLCDHPANSFSWHSSQAHSLNYFRQNYSSCSPTTLYQSSLPSCSTNTAITAADQADQASKNICSPKSTDSSHSSSHSSSSSTAPNSISSNTPTPTSSSKQQRKTLNRGPRIPFTSVQVAELEGKFAATQYLSSMEVSSLAKRLSLTDNRIRIWFQNRRAREKREHRAPSTSVAAHQGRTTEENGEDQLKMESLENLIMTTTANSVSSDAEFSCANADLNEKIQEEEAKDQIEVISR